MKQETKLQNKISNVLDYLIQNKNPIVYEKRTNRGLSYKKGSPDMWLSFNGQHIEIELKVGNNERSSLQIKWEEKCKRNNIEYWLIYTYDEFINNLYKLSSSHKLILRGF